MPTKSTNLIKGLENPSRNLANLTPVSSSLCTPISFQAFSSPLSPFSQSLLHVHTTVQSNSDFTLDSTLTLETTPVSTPLLFTSCITHHSTLQCTLQSTLQSILHHLHPPAFPPHSPPFHRAFPTHLSLPLHSITQLRK